MHPPEYTGLKHDTLPPGTTNFSVLPGTKIIWKISRAIRKTNYSGYILIVTNPVDLLSWAIYYFSNLNNNLKTDAKGLFSNQILGIGLGLDYSRLKTITKKNYEFIGEHGKNLILSIPKLSKLVPSKNKRLLKKSILFNI